MALPTGNALYDSLLAERSLNTHRCVRRPSSAAPMSTIIVAHDKGTRTIFHDDANVEPPSAAEFKAEFPCFVEYSLLHFESKRHTTILERSKQLVFFVQLEITIRYLSFDFFFFSFFSFFFLHFFFRSLKWSNTRAAESTRERC